MILIPIVIFLFVLWLFLIAPRNRKEMDKFKENIVSDMKERIDAKYNELRNEIMNRMDLRFERFRKEVVDEKVNADDTKLFIQGRAYTRHGICYRFSFRPTMDIPTKIPYKAIKAKKI